MAKKAELLEQAKKLKLEVSSKNTIAEIEAVIAAADIKPEAVKIEEPETEKPEVAKAGKRSAKAIAEAEEKHTKAEHQHHREEEQAEAEAKPKKAIKPTRSHLERRGKKFREAAKLIEKDKTYKLSEALDLAIKTNPAKFDATVELHIRLNVDPKQADQNIRDTVVLPAGTGKSVRVAVFSDDKVAGADLTGIETITKQLDKGQLDFDVLISAPVSMANLGKYARVLGPRGLMPNPKSGTVTNDLAKAVNEAKAGRVEYRVDSTGIIHVAIGKVSFGPAKLAENANALIASVRSNKPPGIKGNYVQSAFVATSMGPSVRTTLE